MSNIPIFADLLTNDIKREQEQRSKREKSGKYAPSRFGKCYRCQYWSRLAEPESDPIPLKVFKRFRAGNIYHKDLQSLVPRCEVKFEDENYIAFADHVGDNYIVDFKTVYSGQFKVMKKQSKKEILDDKEQYVYQIMAYCHFFEKPIGVLVFVNKDDYDIIQVEIAYSDFKSKILKEMEALNEFWGRKKLPPAIPRAYVNKKTGKSVECNFCSYKTKCAEIEKSTHG